MMNLKGRDKRKPIDVLRDQTLYITEAARDQVVKYISDYDIKKQSQKRLFLNIIIIILSAASTYILGIIGP